MTSISLIGAGVIGETLIAALLGAGQDASHITIVEKRKERAEELIEKYSVRADSMSHCVADADVVLLVVKPQDMSSVLDEIAGRVNPSATVMSLAAGITIAQIENALGDVAVVRVMPNTPAMVNKGMFACSRGTHCSDEQFNAALDLLRPSGSVLEVTEPHQDAVTALSGSGPAYVFLVAEAMQTAGEKLGLEPEVARELTVQTIFGAAQMLRDGGDAATLRQKVTSPAGTTAAALAVLDEHGLREAFEAALAAARDRSLELSQ